MTYKEAIKLDLFQKQQQIIKWLKEYNCIKSSILYLNESIEDIVEAGMGVQYDKDVISKTNNFTSTVENAVIQMDKQDLTNTIKRMKNIIKAIDTGMKVLSDQEQEVIKKSCVENMYYYQFINGMAISTNTAKRLKKRALEKLALVIFGKE